MKIVFMGTPEFAATSLRALCRAGYDVCAAFCQPDRPKGRGQRLISPPVKLLAQEQGIEVFQPETLKDGKAEELIASMKPDMIVVVAYGKILPQGILDIPEYGCINVHASLLPKYRGAAPIQWAVINGDSVTGVTTMYMNAGMDTGDIIMSQETPIGDDETSGQLSERLSVLGAQLLLKTVEAAAQGRAERHAQQDSHATIAPLLTKELSQVDWNDSACSIKNRIRGLNPWPCVSVKIDGKKLKLLKAREADLSGTPGTAQNICGKLVAFCAMGSLVLLEVQPENGKAMSGESYLLGHQIDGEAKLE